MPAQSTPRLFAPAATMLALVLAAAPDAAAEPIDLTGSLTQDGIVVSGKLHGDLAGDVLTLNSAAPKSELTVDLSSRSGPLPPNLTSRVVFEGLGIRITENYSARGTFTIPAWRFGLGGTIDVAAGTADLTPALLTTAIVNATSTSILFFDGSVDPNLGPIARAAAQGLLFTTLSVLNAPNVQFHETISANWTGITPGTASAAFTQDGSGTQIDLAVAAFLAGEILTNATLVIPNLPDFLGNGFNTLINDHLDRALQDAVVGQILELADGLEDANEGLSLDCEEARLRTTQNLAPITCNVAAALSLVGDAPAAAVSEPSALSLLAAALAGLAARRRRKTA